MSENGMAVSAQTTTAFRHDYHHHHHHHHHHQLNASLKSSYNVPPSDSVDACADHGFKGTITVKELSNGKENTNATATTKSFIQQRVERLYGPGALAQGFFVMKKQKSKSYEIEHIIRNGQTTTTSERHSKSMNEQSLLDDGDISESGMIQSSSTPSLPVLRHLRPEFRAQLPITVSKRRALDGTSPPQKNATASIPTLPEEDAATVNGHAGMNCGFDTDSTSSKKKGDIVCNRIQLHDQRPRSVVKDGHYFMVVLEQETKRLLALAMTAEKELETPDLSEDAKGFLRSASGKAKLLVSQKMQQFKGLCRNNLTQVAGEAFPTTNEDLQGFWDMIMLQVHQIDDLFVELDRLKQNNWQEETPVSTSSSSNMANSKGGSSRKLTKLPSRPVSAVAEENRKQREIQRKKMIEEKRRAMKEHQQRSKTPRHGIEIYVPESS